MIRRLFWFTLGVFTGAYGIVQARKKAGEIAEHLTPSAVLNAVLDLLTALTRRVIDLITSNTASSPHDTTPPAA